MLRSKGAFSPGTESEIGDGAFDIVVFCHLRWEFVFQRPQHIVERLSKSSRVLFVEEPVDFEPNERGEIRRKVVSDRIEVLQPRSGQADWKSVLPGAVNAVLEERGIRRPVLWFYSAAFQSVIPDIEHSLVVYDCMDELSAFKGAPSSLIADEKLLIQQADIVFTGGKSLYESKRQLHGNVHCFPSSVDIGHFAAAGSEETAVPADLHGVVGPIVGYYGVVDERIDLELLADVAARRPECSFVVIGPVVKISPDDLPKLPNIHYLGQRSYSELPGYLKAFDVCMMPFALNAATEFISPTKTLEFMAARKPVVSTAIRDVVRDYSGVVEIAHAGEEFARAIDDFLRQSDSERRALLDRYSEILANTSWDRTVSSMRRLIQDAIQEPLAHSGSAVLTEVGR